jgi:hypothetical protein
MTPLLQNISANKIRLRQRRSLFINIMRTVGAYSVLFFSLYMKNHFQYSHQLEASQEPVEPLSSSFVQKVVVDFFGALFGSLSFYLIATVIDGVINMNNDTMIFEDEITSMLRTCTRDIRGLTVFEADLQYQIKTLQECADESVITTPTYSTMAFATTASRLAHISTPTQLGLKAAMAVLFINLVSELVSLSRKKNQTNHYQWRPGMNN